MQKYPPTTQKSRRGSAILILVIISIMISSMLIIGIAKLTQIAFSSTNSNGIAMQVQQYAASEAELQKKVNYKDLADAAKSVIAGTDFQQEVTIFAESDYSDAIKVYNGSENLPRVSLNLVRYSVEQKAASDAPIGTIIAWISTQNPSDGIWLDCNGQSCAAYTELVAVLGKNTVPDLRGRFLEGAAVPGILKEAGLPNITGSFSQELGNPGHFSGAFYLGTNVKGTSSAPDGANDEMFMFDASRCSSIYGNSNIVQPPAVTVRYLIKAA